MKIEEATSEDIFDYLFDVRVGKLLSEKGRKYLYEFFENRIQNIFNLMKILMII